MKSAIVKIPTYKKKSFVVKANGPCFGKFIQGVKKSLSEEQASKTKKDSLEIVNACIGIIDNNYGKKGLQSLVGKALLLKKSQIKKFVQFVWVIPELYQS